jgi:hypothetical protein
MFVEKLLGDSAFWAEESAVRQFGTLRKRIPRKAFQSEEERKCRSFNLAVDIDKYPPDHVDDGNYWTDATFMDWPMSGMRDPPSIGHPTADGGYFFWSFQTIALGH